MTMRFAWLLLVAACLRHVPPDSAKLGDDLDVRRIADGVWLHTSWQNLPGIGRFPSNGLIVAGREGAVLIDTAWTPERTDRLAAWIESSMRLPIAGVVVTHSHDDRVGGLPALDGVPVWALPATSRRAGLKARAVPEDGAVDIAGVRLEILYPGPAHAPDNIVVYLPAAGVLFGGCMVRSAAATDLGNPADADPASWKNAIAMLVARYAAARKIVPGHGDIGGIELLTHTQELLTK